MPSNFTCKCKETKGLTEGCNLVVFFDKDEGPFPFCGTELFIRPDCCTSTLMLSNGQAVKSSDIKTIEYRIVKNGNK